MPQFDVAIQFEVFCSCGEGLCNNTETRESRGRGMLQAVVRPCPKCLDEAKREGHEEGYDKGRSSGYDDGKNDAELEFEKQREADELQREHEAATGLV